MICHLLIKDHNQDKALVGSKLAKITPVLNGHLRLGLVVFHLYHTSLPAQQYKYYSEYALSNAFTKWSVRTIRWFVKLFLRILFKMHQIFHQWTIKSTSCNPHHQAKAWMWKLLHETANPLRHQLQVNITVFLFNEPLYLISHGTCAQITFNLEVRDRFMAILVAISVTNLYRIDPEQIFHLKALQPFKIHFIDHTKVKQSYTTVGTISYLINHNQQQLHKPLESQLQSERRLYLYVEQSLSMHKNL